MGVLLFLYQPTSGYCYNSDSLFLYAFIASMNPKGKLLDVGCGVGVISLLVSRDYDVQTHIIDIQPSMLAYAKHNFWLNQKEVVAYLDDFSLFETQERFDMIVSNPPFYDSQVTQSENTHLNTARYAHHLPIEAFFKKVKTLLKPRGYFLFCYDAKQVDVLLYHLKKVGLNVEKMQFVYAKIDKNSKLVMICARVGSKSMTEILPPYVVMDEHNNYNEKPKRLFEQTNIYSIKGDF